MEAFENAKGANVKTYTYNAVNGVQLTSLQRDVTPTGGTTTRTRQRFFYNHGDIYCVTQDTINPDLSTATQSTRSDCAASTGGTISPLLDQSYGYDSLDRLDGFHGYEAGTETDSGAWTYDALDRVSSETEVHKPSSVNTTTVRYGNRRHCARMASADDGKSRTRHKHDAPAASCRVSTSETSRLRLRRDRRDRGRAAHHARQRRRVCRRDVRPR
jgi:hypothetical protein